MKSDLLHLDIHQSSRTPTLALVLLVSTLLLLGCGRRAATPPAAPAPTVTPTVAIATATATPSTAAPNTGAPDLGPLLLQTSFRIRYRQSCRRIFVLSSMKLGAMRWRCHRAGLSSTCAVSGSVPGTTCRLGRGRDAADRLSATSAGQGVGVVAATDRVAAIGGCRRSLTPPSSTPVRHPSPLVLALINRWLGESATLPVLRSRSSQKTTRQRPARYSHGRTRRPE